MLTGYGNNMKRSGTYSTGWIRVGYTECKRENVGVVFDMKCLIKVLGVGVVH